jgi:adenosine deaminase
MTTTTTPETTPSTSSSVLWDTIQQIPKVELHAHLNGCIRTSTLFALAEERGVTLPAHLFAAPSNDTHDNDKDVWTMYNRKPRSLHDCFAMFEILPLCVNDLISLRRITYEALQDFHTHHVVYVELRSTPKRLWDDFRDTQHRTRQSKRAYIETILSVMQAFQQTSHDRYQRECNNNHSCPRLPMTCRLIVSIDRSQSLEECREHIDLAIHFYQQHATDPMVVGVDLGGNPTKGNFMDFCSEFQRARTAGLQVTLHCAEVSCGRDNDDNDIPTQQARAEAQAMLDFCPDRLGHALLLPLSLQRQLLQRVLPATS